MTKVKLLIPAVTLAAFASLPLASQQPSQPAPDVPQQQPSAQPNSQPGSPSTSSAPSQQTTPSQPGAAAAVPVPSTANAPEANNPDLRPVSGELVSKIDTKSAKNGDSVVVKTTEKATIGNGVVIPKGSKITGHITDVQAHDGTNQNSKVAIQFDQAEIKGGQTMPIKSVLQAVEPATGSDASQSSPFNTGSAPSAPPSGGASASAGAASPSGSPSASSQAPMQSGSTAAPASPGASAAATGGYPAEGTVVARQGNIEIKTTAMPGVLIAAPSNGQPFANASGALLGARQNVHLDGGTRMTLAIADANTKPGNNR
ncbi:hypothetical protein DYQ86_19370 [Acidobacteria bacterium AB60]|nr:hypothetical protein DYQ86_19370 [Acidobacteria bacterium AB60]